MNLQEQLNRIQSMMGLLNEDRISKLTKMFQQEIESQGIMDFLHHSQLDINQLSKTFGMSVIDFMKKMFVGNKLSSGIIPGEANVNFDFVIDDIDETGEFNTIIFHVLIVGGQVTFDTDGWLDEPGTYDLFDPQIKDNEAIWYDIKYDMVDSLEYFFQILLNKDGSNEYNVEVKPKIKFGR